MKINKNFFKNLLSEVDYEMQLLELVDNKVLDNIINNPGGSIQYNDGTSKNRNNAIPAELGDLARLMHIITSLKVTSILEFGSGKSTVCCSFALNKNKWKYKEFVRDNLRISEPWKLFSVETDEKWLLNTAATLPEELKDKVEFHLSKVQMGTFNGRICTFYESLPNCRPDFIYLDGPSQFDPINSFRGISTNFQDRMPMSGDILLIEYFLEPGCVIVVDGRTANARFLRNNFQRSWHYEHIEEYDQHFFLLNEPSLGKFNQKGIDFRFD